MAIKEKDGFLFLDDEKIVVETDRIDEYVEYILKNNISSVYLCNLYYKGNNIDFLKKICFIEDLTITSSGIKNMQALKHMTKLKKLSIEKLEAKTDLGELRMLEELGIGMNKYVVGIEKLINLKKLRLYNYNPQSKSLNELRELISIEELKISNSSIESFKGCGALTKLRKLELNYLRKLTTIDELEKVNKTLNILEFNSCKKIVNHDYVSCLTNLSRLSFNECSEIENIDFIMQMPKLETFIFMNTNVVDGKLNVCQKLKYVAFTNKRHFSNKLSDFR